MGRRDAGTRGADVERLGKLNEFNAGGIDTAKKHGQLEPNARGPASVKGIHPFTFLVYFNFQAPPGGTTELVRLCIFNARK
jgi:hypothetical protein